MDDVLQFLTDYGYAVLFLWILVERIGLPLPSVPVLLAAGALAAGGRLELTVVVTLAVAASLLSDLVLYELGRRRGAKVLKLLCRISLEPDSCVRKTESAFARHGARSLLLAKYVPGLTTAAPPLAGIFGMRLGRFLAFDLLGTLLWAGSFIALGYVFSDQLERVVTAASQLGGSLAAILAAALLAYIAWKYIQRRRFLAELRISRITPEELKAKLDAGEDVVIVDLRHSLEFEANPHIVPGAITMPAEEVEQRREEIPRGKEVIFYCT